MVVVCVSGAGSGSGLCECLCAWGCEFDRVHVRCVCACEIYVRLLIVAFMKARMQGLSGQATVCQDSQEGSAP